MSDVDALVTRATEAFGRISDPDELERVKAQFLGKSGSLTAMLKALGKLEPDLRREAGALQVGMNQLVAAFGRGEQNPAEREDLTKSMSRIKVQAEGAVGLINYAEQIADQLQRLGG